MDSGSLHLVGFCGDGWQQGRHPNWHAPVCLVSMSDVVGVLPLPSFGSVCLRRCPETRPAPRGRSKLLVAVVAMEASRMDRQGTKRGSAIENWISPDRDWTGLNSTDNNSTDLHRGRELPDHPIISPLSPSGWSRSVRLSAQLSNFRLLLSP